MKTSFACTLSKPCSLLSLLWIFVFIVFHTQIHNSCWTWAKYFSSFFMTWFSANELLARFLKETIKLTPTHRRTRCACTPCLRTLQGGSEEPLIIDFPSYFFCLLQWISYLQHIACYGLPKHTYSACKMMHICLCKFAWSGDVRTCRRWWDAAGWETACGWCFNVFLALSPLAQGKEGKLFPADVWNERETQNYTWCLHSLSGNFGGLSLTSVRVILTSVVPDSPPMWPPMSLAWITTLYSWRASRSMFSKAVRIIPEWADIFTVD